MSRMVDQRVVEMQFDNRHFERNVATTMSTIDKLKQSLNFSGATKGLDDVSSAAKGINLSGIGSAVETVQAKFSALGVIGATALANITNSAVNAGKRIVSALTIDPIKTGFQEYETQIGAVQTILANTKSKGTTIDDVNSALDELNLYADKTIYNFTEMTRNIGTFTAAGVDLDSSVSAIKGIANLAAVSGSTSQQASTAMYQLSQALAAGKVHLMDWNSVVNAGMGGQVFQDALKRTAKNMGTDVDAMIKKYGSFRESLTKGEWLTAEVLTETLSQLAGAYTEADLLAKGYTQEQTKEILELAQTAEDAATKVKTFTQLWDTLKEAAQSGWSQTWEILIGDFEEAKETMTKFSDVIGEMIGNSAKARNELLQGWKDAGGRADLLDSIWNTFDGIMNLVTPIKEAFRNIFPPLTVEQLTNFTSGLKELTNTFKEFTAAHADDIRSAFEGIFSVLDIGWTFIKDLAGGIRDLAGNFTGLGGGIFETAGSFGEYLSNLRDSIKENDIFGKAVDNAVEFLSNGITKIKEFGTAIKESFQPENFEGFVNFFDGVWNVFTKIGSKIGDVFGKIGDVWKEAFSGDTNFMNVVNSGLFAGILIGVQKFVDNLNNPLEALGDIFEGIGGKDGIISGITDTLDSIRGCFEAYQNQLNANALMKIAGAIGILAASIFVLAKIDPDGLDQAVGAMTVLFGELLGSMAIFSKISTNFTGVAKACGVMITMSVSIGILAGAMTALSKLDWEGIGKGLVGVGGLMAELALFLNFAKIDGKMTKTAVGITILAAAMLILAKAVEDFGSMEWSQIGKGLAAIGGLLAELAIFSRVTGKADHVMSTGLSMVLLASSMKIMASAMSDFGSMDWSQIGKGLAAMGGALAELTLAMRLMPTDTLGKGVGLIAIGAAMKILASAMGDFGGMQWDEIGRGLVVMGGALAELAIALNLMSGAVAGSAALLIAAGALAIIAPVMQSLGELSWGEIGKGLATIAGAFAVVGVAGALLTPLVPTLLALSGAMALFGVSVMAIGAGIALLGVGLGTLATSAAAGATALVAALSIIVTGVAGMIPTLIEAFGEAILAFCEAIRDCAPAIAETILIVISEVLQSLAQYAPQIVESLFDFFVGVLEALAAKMPELMVAAIDLVGSFFEGIGEAFKNVDPSALLDAALGVGAMTALMLGLSALSSMVPSAMAGVLGMGALIAELALVLAAVGALSQIPGLNWLIEEGGALLQNIGNAIGGLIGGIVGGFAEGATSTLPEIGSHLSGFMDNAKSFIEGAKNLDASAMDGVKSLAGAILALTAADVLNGISAWLTGGSSLVDFGEQLVPFGESMKAYADSIKGIDAGAVEGSANAAKALADFATEIPNIGGLVSKITGDNDLSKFGEALADFGPSLKEYANSVKGIDSDAVTGSANAAQALADFATNIPNIGGLIAKITGDNDLATFGESLVPFGKSLSAFSEAVAGFDLTSVTMASDGANAIVDVINGMSDIDTSGVYAFETALTTLGGLDVQSFVSAFSGMADQMTGIGADIAGSLASGINTGRPAIVTAITTVVVSAVSAIRSKASDFQAAGASLMTAAASGVASGAGAIKSTITSAVAGASEGLRSQYAGFYSAGVYLIQGFSAGINASAQSVAAQAAAVAISAKNAVEAALGINSPSRVFYEIGDYTIQGFTNALADSTGTVESASAGMASSVKRGFSDAIGKISNFIDSNMDLQPTIRPILDLSDVRSGAGSISSMLGMRSSIGVMTSVGSISANMSRYGQNGANEDVVSAIDKLRKDLGNLGTTQYNINGVTYDDGSNISDAVGAIVRAAKIARRV